MLRALLERGVRPDLVVGCSVGAVNGAAVAADPTLRGISRLEDLWRRVDEFGVMPPSRLPSPLQMARRGPAIHRNEGLRRLLEHGLLVPTFEQLRVPFTCVATDVETAEEAWFDHGSLVEAIMASAALPAVFPPMVVAGRRYLDGGVVNDVPVTKAVERGATRLVVLQTGVPDIPTTDPRRPFDAAVWAYWLARRNRLARDLAALPPGVACTLLGPPRRPRVHYDDFSRSAELVAQGYDAAVALLEGADAPPCPRAPTALDEAAELAE
jgi:NTE family protein